MERRSEKKGTEREHWKLTVPFLLQVLIYHGVATILYLTAFIANVATLGLNLIKLSPNYNNLTAASVRYY